MTRISRYSKPKSYRLRNEVDDKFKAFCKKAGINESEVIQAAIGCFLKNKSCIARKDLKK